MAGHSLGPHAIGQRVVVRRMIPGESGPTGGPAFTDVLGVCEAWGDGQAAIRREDGAVVSIPVAQIVSGKPVPPRPSPRHRISAREAESHAAPLWPGVERRPLGNWELRAQTDPGGRLLKRVNSCLAMGEPGLALAEAEAAIRAFYGDLGRAPLVQVEAGSEIEDAFTGAGWLPAGGESVFLLGSLGRARRRLAAPTGHRVAVSRNGDRIAASTAPGPEHGRIQAGVDGDWIGVHDLWVEPQARQRGIGGALLGAALEAGAEQGALHLWLHVESGNEIARSWYGRLGLGEHHHCRYLAPAG